MIRYNQQKLSVNFQFVLPTFKTKLQPTKQRIWTNYKIPKPECFGDSGGDSLILNHHVRGDYSAVTSRYNLPRKNGRLKMLHFLRILDPTKGKS